MVDVGSKAPDFKATNIGGEDVYLKDFLGGKNTVLVFYRGDWCPWCNTQLSSLGYFYKHFEDAGAQVIAISVDGADANSALKEKLQLPYTVLSDQHQDAVKSYGVLETKSGLAYPPGIARPAVFVLDKDTVVRYAYISKHYADRAPGDEILETLSKI